MRDGRMHQTTVRFGADLWEALEVECGRLGVSAAQYLREAALARLAYTAGQRGDKEYEHALVGAGVAMATSPDSDESGDERTLISIDSERMRQRAREVRAEADRLRRQRKGK